MRVNYVEKQLQGPSVADSMCQLVMNGPRVDGIYLGYIGRYMLKKQMIW